MNSAIYTGRVHHRRHTGVENAFSYNVCYFLIDIDELGELAQRSRFFGSNAPAWFSFQEVDYANAHISLRESFDELRGNVAHSKGRWTYRVLTIPRIAGYAFNPITVVYCYTAKHELGAVIYQVRNTFGEKINYVTAVNRDRTRIRHRCEKDLFVSPFFDMDGFYEFDLIEPARLCEMKIDYYSGGERRLSASFRGTRREFTAREIRRVAVIYPLAALKVVGGIHYEALKLWLKGVSLKDRKTTRRSVSLGTEL